MWLASGVCSVDRERFSNFMLRTRKVGPWRARSAGPPRPGTGLPQALRALRTLCVGPLPPACRSAFGHAAAADGTLAGSGKCVRRPGRARYEVSRSSKRHGAK